LVNQQCLKHPEKHFTTRVWIVTVCTHCIVGLLSHFPSFESGVNDIQKECVVERFAQELHCAITHGANPHLRVTMRRDEDDWYFASLGFKPRMQFKTGHTRHLNVGDQACSLVSRVGLQKLFRGAEANRGQAI
jgi:hypothetical protein